jgi:HEAT repeat protein
MKAKRFLIGLLIASAAFHSSAQAAEGTYASGTTAVAGGATAASGVAPADQSADEAAKKEQKRRDTILYGIDAEIIELLKTLGAEKEVKYEAELLALLEKSRGSKLRGSLLDFFALLDLKGAEASALSILEARDGQDAALVSSALSYLAAIKSVGALPLARDLMKEEDKKLLPLVIRLMGRAGGAAEEETILAWFEGDTATDETRIDAIRALGDIGSTKAAARLATLAADPEGKKASRIYACEALGKIRDDATIPSLVKAANGIDPNVRAAAVAALRYFSSAESDAALVEALRDSFPAARIEACKGIASRGLASALPFLRYKASSDPDKGVRSEGLRSLAALGGEAFAFLRERMNDKNEDPSLRVLCFGLLARKDPEASMEAMKARLSAEGASKDRGLYTALAREISGAGDALGAGPLARLLLADADYLIRVAGVEWIRKSKALDFKPELERLSKDDPAELIRKRATEALRDF